VAGYIEDRWLNKKKDPKTGKRERTERWGKGKRYKVAGIPGVRACSFHSAEDAKAWLKKSATKKAEGTFVDPREGEILLETFIVEKWWPAVEYPPSSRSTVESRVWCHIIDSELGQKQLNEVDYEALKLWKKQLLSRVAPASARAVWAHLHSILEAARKAKRIFLNPCHEHRELKPEGTAESKAKAWPRETVDAIRVGMQDRYQIAVDLGVGLGLRQGEVFGLGAEDIDWLAGVVHVQRQVRFDTQGRGYFCLPKGRKTRDVPIPPKLAASLRAGMERFRPKPTTLPWQDPEEPLTDQEAKQRKPRTAALLVYNAQGKPVKADWFNRGHWKPALESAGVIERLDLTKLPKVAWRRPKRTYGDTREHGFHCLRHTFASVNLEAGESPVTVSTWMGHGSVKITLDTYGHMMPGAGQKGLAAMDAWFTAPQPQILPQDSPQGDLTVWDLSPLLVGAGVGAKSIMNRQFKRVDFVEEPEAQATDGADKVNGL
jgi:integrase